MKAPVSSSCKPFWIGSILRAGLLDEGQQNVVLAGASASVTFDLETYFSHFRM